MNSAVDCPDRVVACVGRIAQDAARTGFGPSLDRCLEDVEALRLDRRISAEQREALRLILLGIGLHAA